MSTNDFIDELFDYFIDSVNTNVQLSGTTSSDAQSTDTFTRFMDTINEHVPLTSTTSDYSREMQINRRILEYVNNITEYLQAPQPQVENEIIRVNGTPNVIGSTNEVRSPSVIDYLGSPNNLFLLELFFGSNIGDLEDVKVTLTPEQFNKLDQLTVGSESASDVCNICMDNYTESPSATILPKCKHMFHTECIRNWLCKEKVTCPVCRCDVRESQN
ncbi:hypothetical protein EB118_04895 [bacterium]|nr:hypothetical protein [bacterium]NDC94175.1 hypothetical protein [bacterium]NDD82773.1 hypothetical protein [bacterium]NDG29424.1 hypothetical protein [bacterium]